MRLRRLPLADAEREVDADAVRRLPPVQQARPARSLAVEAEAEELIRPVRLPIPPLQREAKHSLMQAAPNAMLPICAARPGASTWCVIRW